MKADPIVVLGGSIAGLATALHLARADHRVVVLERDETKCTSAADAWAVARKGVAHFEQPHAFMPLGRKELREHLGDVYDLLIASGAHDVDLRPKLPGELEPQDADLQYLAVRRPLIEWALRDAADREALIELRHGVEATGLRVDGGRIVGAVVDGEAVPARLVVDAMGRRSKTPEWLAQSGYDEAPPASSDCGVVYYSRYYQTIDGFELPEGPWLLGPRGDLGYLGFTTFPGDNGTFAALLAVPTGMASSRVFKQSAAFDAAIAEIPAVRSWVDPEGTVPITDVMTMAGLRNSLRAELPANVAGLFPVGDALCHTDPVLALGLSFALVEARVLTDVLHEHTSLHDVSASFTAQTAAFLRDRYVHSSELDEQRLRMWKGQPVDFASRDGDYALFSLVAGGVAALTDPELFRMFVRRIGGLDGTDVLDRDEELQVRVEAAFHAAVATGRPKLGPTADEMTAITTAAMAANPA